VPLQIVESNALEISDSGDPREQGLRQWPVRRDEDVDFELRQCQRFGTFELKAMCLSFVIPVRRLVGRIEKERILQIWDQLRLDLASP
jgi:hypothetical protein